MKKLNKENIIVSFIDRLIEKYGFTFNYSKFHYICDHEFYSCLYIRNEYGEDVVCITIIANDVFNEISFGINYDLRSDGSYWKYREFKSKVSDMDLNSVENFISDLMKQREAIA